MPMLITLALVVLLQAAQPSAAVKDFAEWRSQQPAQTQLGELYVRYRELLKQKGLSESEIKDVFLDLERDRWNRMYANPAPSFNTAPNAFLSEVVKTLKPGRALEIGMGQGRNSVYLATLGWDVTGFDISETGMDGRAKVGGSGRCEDYDYQQQHGGLRLRRRSVGFDRRDL
jgi:SAM-dependent methyltransferase